MKVSFLTLGCKVNQYESEAIAEALEAHGFVVVPFGEVCDATVINTCAVTTEGERKARQMVRRAINASPNACIAVTGCASQLHRDSFSSIAGVHYVFGNGKKMQVVDAILSHCQNKPSEAICPEESFDLSQFEPMSIQKSERTRAYIKIEDGCDSRCAYCIIKTARGKVRSKPLADILSETQTLLHGGYREIVLTGIEISAYGKDLGCDLITLLEALDKLPNMGRIRLGSLDPSLLRPAFCERLAKIKHLCHHFHLSLQSGCSRTLAAMRRKNNAEQAKEAIANLRALLPDVTFTADIIVGFPDERDEDFNQTARFLEEVKLLDCHIFAFSPRPGTEAAEMPNQISGDIKAQREKKLQEITVLSRRCVMESFVGTTAEVLFEEEKDGYQIGHTANFLDVAIKSDSDFHNQIYQVYFEKTENNRLIGYILS